MIGKSVLLLILLSPIVSLTNNHVCVAFTNVDSFHVLGSIHRLGSSTAQDLQLREKSTGLFMAVDPLTVVSNFANSGNVPEFAAPLFVSSVSLLVLTLAVPFQLVNSNILSAIVSGTYLEKRKKQLRRVYKASKDGWSAISFHEAVDGRGSGVVVARTIGGATFGGYNPNGWRSTDDYYTSSAAFLWCLKAGQVVKLPVLPGGNCAVFDYATAGPCFGAADLVIGPPRAAVMGGFAGPDAEDISKSAGNLRRCKSAVGSTFDYDSAWPVRGATQLVDVEVYCLSDASE